MIDASRQAALRTLELTVMRRLDGILQGDYRGLLPGHGFDAGEARPYLPGDEVRRIDWNVTARTNEPHVRDTIADRELETTLVVDLSGSMAFGTALEEKRDTALAIAGAIGFLVAKGGNRVAALVAAGSDLGWVRPRSGRTHLLGLLARLDGVGRDTGAGDLAAAIRTAHRATMHRGFVAVVSDFIDDGAWEQALRALSHRHDVLAVEVSDRRELELPDVGMLTMIDPETGRKRFVDTGSAGLRTRLRHRRRGAAGRHRPPHPSHRRRPSRPAHRPGLGRRPGAPHRAPPLRPSLREEAMTFLEPARLALLVLPVAAVVAYLVSLQRREKYAVRFTNLALLDKVAPETPGWRRHAAAAVLLAGVLALVLAVAKPAVAVEVPRDQATVILAIDVSRSMEADDVAPTRIEAARQAADNFLELAPPELEVGIVAFAGSAAAIMQPTVDRTAAEGAIDRLTLGDGTAIGEGILASVEMALSHRGAVIDDPSAEDEGTEGDEEETPAEAIIVLSDGETTMGRSDADGAEAAADADIPVSTVSFGTADGVVFIQGQEIPGAAQRGGARRDRRHHRGVGLHRRHRRRVADHPRHGRQSGGGRGGAAGGHRLVRRRRVGAGAARRRRIAALVQPDALAW